MEKQSTTQVEESRPEWETLEAFARHGVQRLLQRVLAEEVGELLGRSRYLRPPRPKTSPSSGSAATLRGGQRSPPSRP